MPMTCPLDMKCGRRKQLLGRRCIESRRCSQCHCHSGISPGCKRTSSSRTEAAGPVSPWASPFEPLAQGAARGDNGATTLRPN